MCGIVGYVGEGHASEIILDGLRRLEYRGYDSAGIVTVDGARLQIRRRPVEVGTGTLVGARGQAEWDEPLG